jgi:diacylglycerol kinase family enzyme
VAGFVLINPNSGDERPTADELRSEAEGRGLRVHVLREGDDPAAVAREADAEALGTAGGDGSLAAVAGVALERDLPFVCVPFGTRNHFARDLGLDRRDPIAALDAFGGEERRIDVGFVNDRLFLNNVSLGAYAGLVHRRERHRRRRDALARLRALWLTARAGAVLHASVDGEPIEARVIFVGNNAYELDLLNIGERGRLDGGVLHLYTAHGWLPRSWEDRTATAFTIETRPGAVDAAVDGEPERLDSPLRFSTRPRALRVLLPPSQ